LWDSVVDRYELDKHERALLVEAVRTVDLLDHEVRRDVPPSTAPGGSAPLRPRSMPASGASPPPG
jgi:hypothetical protein